MTLVREIVLPDGYRWATGGGSMFGGCNGTHIATAAMGTLCGKIGPATITPSPDEKVCGSCARIVKGKS